MLDWRLEMGPTLLYRNIILVSRKGGEIELLDTHEYDGASVLKCGPECGYFIDCGLDSFDLSAREGLVRVRLTSICITGGTKLRL
jgi:hypothetical protein